MARKSGVTSSIKPQEVTFIVPGIEKFDPTQRELIIAWDPTLLEFAWIELLEKDKSVTVEELAEPLESCCAHLLLSKDDIYFTVLESKGPFSIYGPRPASQVEELVQKKVAKELAEREFQEFINFLKSVKAMLPDTKPAKLSWKNEEKTWQRIESLEAYCIDMSKMKSKGKLLGLYSEEMGLAKTSTILA